VHQKTRAQHFRNTVPDWAVWPDALRPQIDHAECGRYTPRFLFRGFRHDEAYVSTEQPPPETDARISGPDAEEGRHGSALPPPSQGSKTPRCLTARARAGELVQARPQALPKHRRLTKRREYLRVYETGRKLFSRYCVLFFAANDLPFSRIGITATKKIGKANVRNRLKRWTREIYRLERARLDLDENALDIVLNVKPNAAAAKFREFRDDLIRVLQRLREDGSR
jgi:ribonuclease P protein component